MNGLTMISRNKSKYTLRQKNNENTTTQKSMGHSNAALMGKFMVLQAYLRKQEKYQIKNLQLHLN